MFEVSPEVIDANELLYRVETSVMKNNIPKEYFGMEIEQGSRGVENRRQVLLDSLQTKLNWLRESYSIQELPIRSNRPVIGKFIVFAKKVFRKLTRWLFASYYHQQTTINGVIVQTMTEMMELQEMLITIYDQEKKGE
ncbi:MAG: hypothetical protein IJZ44_07000 [Lachnospiraceae bacterium]|nr:hypothetical protein [Lachnospiraceae bacterium]